MFFNQTTKTVSNVKKRFSEIRRLHTYLLTIFPLLPPLPFQPTEIAKSPRRDEMSNSEEGWRWNEEKKMNKQKIKRKIENTNFKGEEIQEKSSKMEKNERTMEDDEEKREERRSAEVGCDERKIKRKKEEMKTEREKALYIKMALEKYLEEVIKVEGVRNNRIVKDFFEL